MHVLVTNHDAEIAVFRQGLGAEAPELRVVDNNLSVLSLLSTNLFDIRSLVITEHQDEGINVETRTFVRNLTERAPDAWPTLIVSPSFGDFRGLPVQLVATIEEAAAIVAQLEPALPAAVVAGNGHSLAMNGNGYATATAVPAPAELEEALPAVGDQPEPVAQIDTEAASATVATPTAAPPADAWLHDEAPAADPQSAAAPATHPELNEPSAINDQLSTINYDEPTNVNPLEQMPVPAHSLADDIRNWTERSERQRNQHHTPPPPNTLLQGLLELLPANRRIRTEEERLNHLIRQPRLARCQSIAVISPKGGVGKSFLTYVIGNFLADVRGDKVVAIDTNPDFGTLADQVRDREQQTVSTLLQQVDAIKHYSDLRRFTSKVDSRLEVLAAPADPDVMATITSEDYGVVNTQLRHYYDTVLFDCGTGFRDDITRFALGQADQVVLVSAPLFITTGIVIRALGYLDQVGVPLDRVTLAINQVRRESSLDLQYMHERFGSRLNAIVEIPFDMQLHQDMDRGEFSVQRTHPATRVAIKQLLAELAKQFA